MSIYIYIYIVYDICAYVAECVECGQCANDYRPFLKTPINSSHAFHIFLPRSQTLAFSLIMFSAHVELVPVRFFLK